MSHPNAVAWWQTLSLKDKVYWTDRFYFDKKEPDETAMSKEDYCYQTMIWERSENGSC